MINEFKDLEFEIHPINKIDRTNENGDILSKSANTVEEAQLQYIKSLKKIEDKEYYNFMKDIFDKKLSKKSALHYFENGFGISVITEKIYQDEDGRRSFNQDFYITEDNPYEVGLMMDGEGFLNESDNNNGFLTQFINKFDCNPVGYCNEEKVTEIIQFIKAL